MKNKANENDCEKVEHKMVMVLFIVQLESVRTPTQWFLHTFSRNYHALAIIS